MRTFVPTWPPSLVHLGRARRCRAAVPSGIYFARLRADGQVATQRFVFLAEPRRRPDPPPQTTRPGNLRPPGARFILDAIRSARDDQLGRVTAGGAVERHEVDARRNPATGVVVAVPAHGGRARGECAVGQAAHQAPAQVEDPQLRGTRLRQAQVDVRSRGGRIRTRAQREGDRNRVRRRRHARDRLRGARRHQAIGPHHLVVLVLEDVAVPDVARLGGCIEREVRRSCLRREADDHARHLARIHLERVLPAHLLGLRQLRLADQVGRHVGRRPCPACRPSGALL